MEPIDLLTRERVRADLRVSSKKKLLDQLSELLADGRGPLVQEQIFDALVVRERQSPTGLGGGIALPHGRLQGDFTPTAAVLRLRQPVDFDAIDGVKVDLVFALVIPDYFTEQHLSLLAQVAEMFADEAQVQSLRSAANDEALYRLLQRWFQRRP
jgi:PTS system nitrogen regulatory IIA component